jgi:uncharacterized protein YdeI (YjbR/CyaY-like superfamily)
MVVITKTVYVPTRAAWRKWLEKNHHRVDEIWLIYPKKASGRPRVAYRDAVEEALCFGWIDGIVKPIDEFEYTQRFTPRRRGSNWSDLNRRLFARLVEEGLMTEAGLAVGPRGEPRKISAPHEISDRVPADVRKAFRESEPAWTNFQKLAPGHRRHYLAWIGNCKKPETRARRIATAIDQLHRNLTRAELLRGK